MNWIKTANNIVNTDKDEQKFIIHEIKYAVLGVILFIIFAMPFTNKMVCGIFPIAKGPMILIYKILLYLAIYYIIQKSEWFQQL